MDKQENRATGAGGVVLVEAMQGFYLSADGDNPCVGDVWCFDCGIAKAFHLRKRRGVRGCHIALAYGESDHLEYCAGCKKLVDAGELSEHGLAEEFAYYEEHPPEAPHPADAQVLAIMLGSCWNGDPRYDQIEAWLQVAVGS